MSAIRCVALFASLCCGVIGALVLSPVRTTHAAERKTPDRKPPAKVELPALKFEVGKETTIEQSGLADGHFILYVPKDYTPDRDWPMIFCYHGINQSAKVWPFKELTDGKGFIVVGMSYVEKNGAGTDREWESLARIGQLVAGTLKVNPRMVFIGGFSLGGVWTYKLSAKNPAMFAGVIAFGMSGSPGSAPPGAWQGKPVLIAHGEKDEYCQKIGGTLDSFGRVGAQVTHEVFKGQGHTVDTNNAVCKQWLRDNGPRRALQLDLEAAKAVEKSGKLGAAMAMYEAVAKAGEGDAEITQAAKDAAGRLTDAADKKLAEAEEAVAAHKIPAAVKTLTAVERSYAGSPAAEKAASRRKELQSDVSAATKSAAKPDAKQYDAPADAGKQMERDCNAWMSLADSYIKAGAKAKAKPLLQRIIDTYPESPQAATARRKLAGIP